MHLKESSFPNFWKVSSMIRVFKNVGKRSRAKNYHLVTVFSMVSKIFEKLANNRLVIPLKKGDLLSHF